MIEQRAIYADEQKATWLAWGEIVENQIATKPSNVIPIKSRKSA